MSKLRLTCVPAVVLVLGGLLCLFEPEARAGGKPTPTKNADSLGYSAVFAEELKKIGEISPAEFAKRYPAPTNYLARISWDPTKAKFANLFKIDPALKRAQLKPGTIYDDFRLSEEELAVFKKNGFVVTERLGTASFGEMFYRIFSRDLPVYVSSDALLHAWHRSYDYMLQEMEETYLGQSLDEILSGMAGAVPQVNTQLEHGELAPSVKDADFYLSVARSLLAGKQVKSTLGQEQRVAEVLKACESLELLKFPLFGRERIVDFSQFKVRGHYESTEFLRRYFQAMMWCGRIDLRVAGNPTESSPRELGSAVVLHELLTRAGKFEQWRQFDRMIQTFVGCTDSMTFAQLGSVLAHSKIKSAADVNSAVALRALQDKILEGKFGLQHIRGDAYVAPPFGSARLELPRSFTVLGQKFVVDSWVTSKIVFDDIVWQSAPVQRRIPSALDVAFAAFKNDQVVPLLTERITKPNGRTFRDGLNYQHNLAAVRNVVDAQEKTAWDENLYMNWLACLRELSTSTTDAKYPEVMRTEAWAMKTLNTQLASWTQLRHDTILYVKQSYTAMPFCEYPAGYVEPVPHFWMRLGKMALKAAELIESTPFPNREVERKSNDQRGTAERITLAQVQKNQAAFFRHFAKEVGVLKGIVDKQLDQKELTLAETKFLKEIVQLQRHGSGSTWYGGWYPGLFYKERADSGRWDAIVADVHTNTPAPMIGDPGCILHQGVGNVDFLFIAVENGKDRMVFAGPVMSHYEFEMPGVARKSDSEWRKDIRDGKLPPRPDWTRSYFVAGENANAKHYWHPDDR